MALLIAAARRPVRCRSCADEVAGVVGTEYGPVRSGSRVIVGPRLEIAEVRSPRNVHRRRAGIVERGAAEGNRFAADS